MGLHVGPSPVDLDAARISTLKRAKGSPIIPKVVGQPEGILLKLALMVPNPRHTMESVFFLTRRILLSAWENHHLRRLPKNSLLRREDQEIVHPVALNKVILRQQDITGF
jgi:hypothetical protein